MAFENFIQLNMLSWITDRILSEFDKGNAALAIFLDLAKAFDTLNHNILLTKLNYFGIQNSTLNWFQSYLSNRQHYAGINQCKSNILTSSLGVPQGLF